jgi:hypothetical protein
MPTAIWLVTGEGSTLAASRRNADRAADPSRTDERVASPIKITVFARSQI